MEGGTDALADLNGRLGAWVRLAFSVRRCSDAAVAARTGAWRALAAVLHAAAAACAAAAAGWGAKQGQHVKNFLWGGGPVAVAGGRVATRPGHFTRPCRAHVGSLGTEGADLRVSQRGAAPGWVQRGSTCALGANAAAAASAAPVPTLDCSWYASSLEVRRTLCCFSSICSHVGSWRRPPTTACWVGQRERAGRGVS